MRRAFDGLVLVDVPDDFLDLGGRVAELREGHRHGVVDDLHQPAADELLVLHERDVGLDAGRVAVHHEADGAGRREHGGLRVPVAMFVAELDALVPHLLRVLEQILRHVRPIDVLERGAVLAHDAEHRFAVLLVAGERAAVVARDARRLRVGGAVHDGRDRRRIVAAGVAVVRQAARHQERAEVRVTQPERPVVVAVPPDRPWSGSWRCPPGFPGP